MRVMCPGSCEAATALSGIRKGFRSGLKGIMKRSAYLILLTSLCAVGALAQQPDAPRATVVRVATAMNHLTVLEFHEPVTMAAAGSSDFQIQRESNKVFVKPMKSGAATDLFVWTTSRRFAYELETTEEVKDMNFAIDSAQPAPAPAPKRALDTETDQCADVVLTRAFLGAEEIKHTGARAEKNQVSVRVEQVFRTRTTVYIHYTIENNSVLSYHVSAPGAYQLQTEQSPILLPSLAHTQLDRALLKKVAGAWELSLPVAHAEAEADDLLPGDTTQGVVSIRQDLQSPAVVQLVFADGIKATVVL